MAATITTRGIVMTSKKRNIGRPYSDPASARARYNDLKQAAATAKSEFEKFQKQCIADDLLNRVIVKEIVIKSFVRKNREDVWTDQINTIRAAGIFERANKIA